MLQITSLTKRFGSLAAVDGLSLTVKPGDIYCLLGANGAGKTTTIKLCLNFLQPDSGAVYLDGLAVAREPLASKRHLAYIPENLMLYPQLSGLENLAYFAGLSGRRHRREQLEGFLRQAGLEARFFTQRVAAYSKGMRQKVGVALALAKSAKVLLLDEPTSGLDPLAANEFARLLEQLRQQGAAILMTTHDLFRAKASGTHIGIMREGKLVDEFATDTVDHARLESLYLAHMMPGGREEVAA